MLFDVVSGLCRGRQALSWVTFVLWHVIECVILCLWLLGVSVCICVLVWVWVWVWV